MNLCTWKPDNSFFFYGDVTGYIFFFFFQAEDGIRDIGVTGVKTCALPISRPDPEGLPPARSPPAAPRIPDSHPAPASWRRRRSPSAPSPADGLFPTAAA